MSLPTNPLNRKEAYLNAIATGNTVDMPAKPITREEAYLDAIAKNGGGSGGAENYAQLSGKPQINNVELESGNNSLSALGIASESAVNGIKDGQSINSFSAVETALGYKVDKVEGKGLSTNDYDDTEKGKVADNTSAIEAIVNELRRTRRDITNDLANLSQAVAEQNLGKYGYTIGDYFTGASGYTYILADYNTFKGTATPHCISTNHIGIVVDTHTTSQWHTENATAVGYNGSTLHTYLKTTVLDNIKADFKALFGGSTGLEHLIAHNKLLTTATANWEWQSDQYISALTCTQVDAGSQWTANGFQEGEASKSLEVFRKYKWTEIFGGEYPWLRNISNYDNSSASFACLVYSYGALFGDNSVTSSYFAVGLINFY